MNAQPERTRPRRWLWLVLVAGSMAALGAVDALRIAVPFQGGQGGSRGVFRGVFDVPLEPVPALMRHPATNFTLPLFSGGTLALHSLRGKPVVMNFWASWCIPCRDEAPLLVRLHKTYGPRGIVFIGVDVQDEERAARAFIGQYHVDYLVVRSSDEKVMSAYGVLGIPTTVFIGPDGVVVDKFAGAFLGAEGEKALVMRLERLLSEATP